MSFRRSAPVGLALVLLAAAGCDDDPNAPALDFALLGCPAAPGTRIDINAPLAFAFNEPVSPNSVSSANVVVTNVETGLAVPGSLNLSQDGTTITFDPDAPLPFDTELRVRVQNVLAAETNTPADLVVCELVTALPEITETPWLPIGPATGTRLFGAALVAPEDGYVISSTNPLLRNEGDLFRVVYSNPYFAQAYDVAFLEGNEQFGWVSYLDIRQVAFGSSLLQTTDGAETFEEIFAVSFQSINRIFMRRLAGAVDEDSVFAVLGGGNIDQASFWKYVPETESFFNAGAFGATSNVSDVDFGPSATSTADTAIGVGASFGVRFDDVDLNPGRVFISTDGGSSWTEAVGAGDDSTVASFETTYYMGAGVGPGGTLYVTGGSGTVLQLTPAAGNTYEVTRILEDRVANPDTLDPDALIYTDVEFAPDNRQIGWIVGGQRIGTASGVPQYRGVIFMTRDGGATWTRQGVAGASSYGSDFPRINRIEVLSETDVWLVGDGGVVLSYAP